MTLSFNRHSERWQECFVRKTENGTVTQSEESITRITSYRPLSFSTFSWQLTANGSQLTADSFYLLIAFLITGTDPSLSLQDDAFRSPSLWRFPFPITSDALSFNRHSERRQKCCSRKTGNGIVTRSEESITLNDILPFSSPRQQILLRWYPKQWANSVSYFQSFVSDPQLTAIDHHSLSERLGLFIKIAAKGIQFLYISMYNKVQTEGSADHLYWCSFYLPVRKTAES